jgi:nicotinate-nucleotide pyrophosphorylase (carboxylating)
MRSVPDLAKQSDAWQLNPVDEQLLDLALTEDLGLPYHDITTTYLFPEKNTRIATAKIISKHPVPIVVCGLPMVLAVLNRLSTECHVCNKINDGEILHSGETLAVIEGPENILMMAERIMLNFLQRLSAIATYTAQFVAQTFGTPLKILDTRKTTPAFRHLEKYAVLCGGGVNHRFGLYDALMIKDTHIDLLGGVQHALNKLPNDILTRYPVIIEVRTLQELEVVLHMGREKISRVLLDNMPCALIKQCVALAAGVIATEASGNIGLDNIRAVAETGVPFASVGKLTHSAGSVDLSMKCD